ncbi:hypothetical protein KOM00_09470 [Geomonas sp. Red69]|uniref:Uncharacterized protein n=1 Tax=Geomonas diazotrophica TaxID=2843197 RepID=A0ABX8JQG0_9BACT|nr:MULTISPECIES: hypothetical protein [Geomonas]MBU5636963.1 hypothetical protein [Geomonas diazotrophica]QWV98862.1 hypothetical protein KP005_06160 [Geomonas nitrogeniifigens]QXE88009.1 hypothetical protein KP003_06310 [Geomonas nitrogeniifigens]
MVRSILEIGNAKYKIDRLILGRFKEEVRQHWTKGDAGVEAPVPGPAPSLDESLELVFKEVMQLYNEYAKTESIDVLLRLKDKLEQVSLRYKSLALAEEVLNINSCLPYERRVPQGSEEGPAKH